MEVGEEFFFSHGTKTAYFFEAELFGDGRALTDEKKIILFVRNLWFSSVCE